MSKKQERLSDRWIAYYTNFATTGDPNKGPSIKVPSKEHEIVSRLENWPVYNISEPLYQNLDDQVKPISPPHQNNCKFWVSKLASVIIIIIMYLLLTRVYVILFRIRLAIDSNVLEMKLTSIQYIAKLLYKDIVGL
jgi:hypothetical protein